MAEEYVDLIICASSEYCWTFMQYEYGYPLLFASLLEDCPKFSESLQKVRCHYQVLVKYEKMAHSNLAVQRFLGNIGFVKKPSVRASWILWSNAPDDKLAFQEQDKRAHQINEARFGGLGDTFSNECSNAHLREFEQAQRNHSNPGGGEVEVGMTSKQNRLITCPALDGRKVPQVLPDFALQAQDMQQAQKAQPNRHAPPLGVLPPAWLHMMEPGVKEFPNPTPESERAEVAAWMWLLEYDSVYGTLPPADRPSLNDGWLATLCMTGFLVEHRASKELFLSLGNETWMVLMVPLIIVRDNLVTLGRSIRIVNKFICDFAEWVVYPARCLSPYLCKQTYKLDRGGMAWQVTGPSVSLLRASLMRSINLTVEDILALLSLCGCGIPSPARKGDCLYTLLSHVFPDWTEDQRRKHWVAMLSPKTEKKAQKKISMRTS